MKYRNHRAINVSSIICLVMLICIPLSSCQQTPKQQVVQNKKQDFLDNLNGAQSAQSEANVFPQNWNTTVKSAKGDLTVEINANINLPNTTKIPVVLIKPADIPQSQADKIISVLIQDKTLYESSEYQLTKDEIISQIAALKKSLSDPEKAKDKDFVEKNNKEINDLQNLLPTAPDKLDTTPALKTFSDVSGLRILKMFDDEWTAHQTVYDKKATEKEYKDRRNEIANSIHNGDNLSIEGDANLGRAYPAHIEIHKTKDNKNNGFSFSNSDYSIKEEKEGSINKNALTISQDSAYDIALKCLKDIGIDYMNMVECNKLTDPYPVYDFIFTRSFDGVGTTYVPLVSGIVNQDYRAPWPQEYASILVDDKGITGIDWTSPSTVIKNLSDNTALLPFDKIEEAFSKDILLKDAWTSDPDIIARKINITRITLGMMYIAKIDSNDEYVAVPVWDFFGNEVDKYSNEYLQKPEHYVLDKNNERTIEGVGSYLTINAIDGSIIDRTKGN